MSFRVLTLKFGLNIDLEGQHAVDLNEVIQILRDNPVYARLLHVEVTEANGVSGDHSDSSEAKFAGDVHASKLLEMITGITQTATKTEFDLSTREIEVLSGQMKGLSQKMIAHKLGISPYTVNNHIKKIYHKLQAHSLAEAILTVSGNSLF